MKHLFPLLLSIMLASCAPRQIPAAGDEACAHIIEMEQVTEVAEPVRLQHGIDALHVPYPALCREAGIQGRVTAEVTIGPDGEIENGHIVQGIGGGCDEALLAAIRDAEFLPARDTAGNRISAAVRLHADFQLRCLATEDRGTD